MKPFIPVFLVIVLSKSLHINAQNLDYFAGARSASLAHSTVAMSDFWALYHNQGAMAFLEDWEFGSSLENRFGVNDLNIGHIGFVMPTEQLGVLGVSAAYMSMGAYQDAKLGLAYARKLSKKIGFGLKINYHNYSVAELGNFGGLTFETGILYKYTEKLAFGFHLHNPSRTRKKAGAEDFHPVVLRVGAEYYLSKKLHLLLEVQKDDELPMVFKGGLEWMLGEILYLRTGLANNPQLNTFGLGVKFSNFKFDASLAYVARLGASPQAGIQYAF